MIKDPVRLTTLEFWDDLCYRNEGNIIFFKSVNGRTITLAEVISVKPQPIRQPVIRKIWSCSNRAGFNRYTIHDPGAYDGIVVKKEEFFEFVKTRTPEYVTWFLFNQEWLM